MVKVTFKNVNQGDSIIIEWSHESTFKTGIIDCNKFNSKINPVLDHIISENIQEIEFLLMSHPHLDHFSGFIELITYCRNNSIKINRFLHTSRVAPEYLRLTSRNSEETKKLVKLFKLLADMQDNDEIIVSCVEENGFVKSLNDEFSIEFLAPSSKDFDNFIKSGSYGFDGTKTKKFDGNYLSTIVNIFNDHSMVLLTSDSSSETFNKIISNLKKSGKNQKLILGQIPHHGSKDNFNKQFWNGIKKTQNTYAVISVGVNSYGHPSEDVLNFFNKNINYNVLKTNSHSTPLNSLTKKINSALDVFSTKIENITYEEVKLGDKSFVISNSTCNLV